MGRLGIGYNHYSCNNINYDDAVSYTNFRFFTVHISIISRRENQLIKTYTINGRR